MSDKKPEKKSIPHTCKSCEHWKNQQAELEYTKFHGICTCYKWKFNSAVVDDCMTLNRKDRSAKHMGVQRFENQSNVIPYNRAEQSNYCFVTGEDFGCIHYRSANG